MQHQVLACSDLCYWRAMPLTGHLHRRHSNGWRSRHFTLNISLDPSRKLTQYIAPVRLFLDKNPPGPWKWILVTQMIWCIESLLGPSLAKHHRKRERLGKDIHAQWLCFLSRIKTLSGCVSFFGAFCLQACVQCARGLGSKTRKFKKLA